MNPTASLQSPPGETTELLAALERGQRAAAKRRIVEELSDRLAVQAARAELFDQDLLEALAREMVAAQLELHALDAPVSAGASG